MSLIAKVAVLGAGTMGHGIAQMFAQYGLQVSLYDISDHVLQMAAGHIRHNLDLIESEHSANSSDSAIRLEQQSIEKRIEYTTNLKTAVQEAGLIVEAVPEQLELKHTLYRELEPYIKSNAVIASNTSSYSLTQLSEGIGFRSQMIILHFFNPANLVPLVEIVKHPLASGESLTEIVDLLRGCGKVPVVLKRDIPGFIANRLQSALLREAVYLLENGIADASDIDAVVKHGPGLRWALQGPLETADLGGLDVWSKVSARLFPLLDASQSAPDLIMRNVQQGNLGTKTGKGIYDYEDKGAQNQVLEERDRKLIRLLRARQSVIQGRDSK